MQRILEPELMDGEQQALAYAQADFSISNQLFVDQLLTDFAPAFQNVIDLGCGRPTFSYVWPTPGPIYTSPVLMAQLP